MASIYKKGRHKNWYVSYILNNRRLVKSLNTCDEKIARLLKKELEVRLEKGTHQEVQLKRTTDCFEEYLRAITHRKVQTNSNEIYTIQRFLRTVNRNRLDKIACEDILFFLAPYEQKAEQTYNNVLGTLRRFFRFAVARNYLLKDPTASIIRKKIPQKEVKSFTDDEYFKIENAARMHPLYPMIVTARYTGLRLQELINLEWNDFDWTKRVVHVLNKKDHTIKNYKNRTVPICEELRDKLLPFVKVAGLCFPVPFGKTKGRKYSIQGPKRTIQNLLRRAGVEVEKGKSWHKLRKTFATTLKDCGVSIAKISDWLGHSSIKVTELYLACTSLYDEDIEKLTLRLISKEGTTEVVAKGSSIFGG